MYIVNLLVISEEEKTDARYAYLEEAGTGDLPVFDLTPEFKFADKQDYAVLSSSFKDGAIIRRAVHDTKTRTFTLRWKNATEATKDRLVELYRNRNGIAGALWYTPVDGGSQVKVRFVEDSFTIYKLQPGNYRAMLQFIELL